MISTSASASWFAPRVAAGLLAGLAGVVLAGGAGQAPAPLLIDGFDDGLGHWSILGGPAAVRVVDSRDAAHGPVMVLEPDGDVLALVRDSDRWGSLRLEGDVRFPTDEDNYLGVAYNVQRRGSRYDFGLIYLKGNDSYLQANPHRDFNVGRALYPEYRVALTGKAAVETGTWARFAVEVADRTCHVYVGDMATPQMTFPLFEGTRGQIGLQPRSVGGPVWVDNVRVTAIDRLSYQGAPRPAAPVAPAPGTLTDWQVAGPLDQTRDDLAAKPDSGGDVWRPFAVDARGAVVTGRAVDYHGPLTVAYFRARPASATTTDAVLHLSTIDNLALWVNGRFHGFVDRQARAWPDFATDPRHAGRRIPIRLRAGANEIVLRVRGGVYASGGFFARLEGE